MSDPLHSARTKLARANLHSRTAEREAGRFFKKHPGPTFRVKPTTDLDVIEIGSNVELEFIIEQGLPDLPPSFSARFGDAIHNYRCALDHVAWQLYKNGRTPNLRYDAERLVQFPICRKKSVLLNELATRLPGVDTRGGGPCEFIEKCHRYKGGQARNRALLELARLSNDDKHRSLHAMVTAVGSAHHQVTFVNCRDVGFRDPPHPPPLKPGAVMGYLTITTTGENIEVKVEPNIAAYVALDGWRNALDTLREIRAEVTKVLNAPQILKAVS